MDDAPIYDKEAVYDAEIAPLVTRLIEICKREAIPFMATFAYSRREENDGTTSFCTTATIGPNGWQPAEIVDAVRVVRNGRTQMFAMTIRGPK